MSIVCIHNFYTAGTLQCQSKSTCLRFVFNPCPFLTYGILMRREKEGGHKGTDAKESPLF